MLGAKFKGMADFINQEEEYHQKLLGLDIEVVSALLADGRPWLQRGERQK